MTMMKFSAFHGGFRHHIHLTSFSTSTFPLHRHHHRQFSFSLQVSSKDDSNNKTINIERSEKDEVDKIVDGMDFGELCNEFECTSVESTARQLARDILELRQGNRALGTYSTSVKYKRSKEEVIVEAIKRSSTRELTVSYIQRIKVDPVRTFTGREKYKRSLWVTDALEKPSVTLQEMMMLSTSVLSIRWTFKGRPKSLLASIGDVIVKVNSQFTLNQISGQVIEHEEFWDLSASSTIAQAFFWGSRRIFATIEAGKDIGEILKKSTSFFSAEKDNLEIYPDPSGDPTKFFQRDDGFQRDVYQIALFLAILYFVVQFLRTTL